MENASRAISAASAQAGDGRGKSGEKSVLRHSCPGCHANRRLPASQSCYHAAVVRAKQTEIEEAVEALRAGELVVFPTETVYGLGANAADPAAVRKIFEVKGRPSDHPVIVHLDNPRYLHRWVSRMVPVAEQLAAIFWPGPLTLILPKADNVNDVVTGGQDSIGIRIPSHPIAQQLLTAFGGGIAAPSANRFGRLSPTKPEHVRDELGVRRPMHPGRRRVAHRPRVDHRVLPGQRGAVAAPGLHHAISAGGGRGSAGKRRHAAAGARATAACITPRRRRWPSWLPTTWRNAPGNSFRGRRKSRCSRCGLPCKPSAT